MLRVVWCGGPCVVRGVVGPVLCGGVVGPLLHVVWWTLCRVVLCGVVSGSMTWWCNEAAWRGGVMRQHDMVV